MAYSTDLPSPTLASPVDVASPTLVSPTDVPSPTFSTLEVDQRASYIHPSVQGLMAFKSEDEGLPQVVQPHVPEHHKSENDTSVSHGDANPKKLAGLSIKAIGFIIAGAIMVTLGAVLGGVFGTRKSHHDFKTPSVEPPGGDTSPSNTRNVNILPNSNISATVVSRRLKPADKDVTTYHLVVFQDIGGAMIARTLNSTGKTWTTLNLTAATENASPINAMYGSPLASAALYRGNDTFMKYNVWYLHPDGTINNVNWAVGRIEVSTRDMVPYFEKKNPRTTLALSRGPTIDYSEKGFDLVYLMQQYTENQIMIINIRSRGAEIKYDFYKLEMQYPSHLDIWPPSQPINSTAESLVIGFESNGRLMATNFYPDTGIGESPMTSVQRLHNTKLTDSAMFKDLKSIYTLSELRADPKEIKQLLTIPYKDSTVHRNVHLTLLSNGTIMGNKNGRDVGPVIISGGPTANFTAIATTDDSRLYGISGDEVLEYVLNMDNNPTASFTFVGKVYP